MKKILPILIILALAASPIWAKKRAKTVEEIPDSYGEQQEEEITAIEVDSSKKKKSSKENYSSDPYNKKKMKGEDTRTGIQKAFNLNKYQKIESFSLYLRNTIGKVYVRKATLIHRAGTDIGGFACYYDTSSYALQFATKSRAILIAAVEQYFKDFEEKKLDQKAKKTDRVYGNCEGYEDYGMAEFMTKDFCRPTVDFGYAFLKGNPYFMIRVRPSKNLRTSSKGEYDTLKENVIEQRYYFTKAQAKKLATFLSDENINALQLATAYETFDETIIEPDTFEGAEESAAEQNEGDAETLENANE